MAKKHQQPKPAKSLTSNNEMAAATSRRNGMAASAKYQRENQQPAKIWQQHRFIALQQLA
jgi:hypothetical protein